MNENMNMNETKTENANVTKTELKSAAGIENTVVSKLRKNPKAARIGSAVTAAAGLIALIARFAVHAEMTGIQNSYAALVVVGSEQMSKAEYLEYASGLISNCTAIGVVLLVIAALLFVCGCKKK